MHKLKGFTFIELIVVMSIITVVTFLGVFGFTNYRSYIQLESTYLDFLSGLKLQRSKAVNSVAYNSPNATVISTNAPDFYGVYMFQSTFRFYYCNKIGSTQYVVCQQDLNSRALVIPTTIQFLVGSCQVIGFAKGSGDIYHIEDAAIFDGGGIYEDIPAFGSVCNINIVNNSSVFTKTLQIDYEKDQF